MLPTYECDVLIVGGGVIGLACAHYLIQGGRKVCVIEQGRVGSGASHGNCGLVAASYLVPLCAPGVVRKELPGLLRADSPLYIKPALDPGLFGWLLNFAGRCRPECVRDAMRARARLLINSDRLFQELFRDHALDAEYERRGHLIVFRTEQGMQGYAAKNEAMRPFGQAAEPVVGRALRALEPALREDVCGAWYHASDGHLRPDRLVQSWKQVLEACGARFEENCRLDGFRRRGDRLQAALTATAEFRAEETVITAGAWSGAIAGRLGLRVPIQPGKGYSITTPPPAECLRIPSSFAERRVVATAWPSGFRLGGTLEFSGLNTALNRRRLAALAVAAGEYLRDPVGRPVIEAWTGMRPMTYDDLPVIGRAPGLRNLTLATGHGMLGISMAPATGRLVAEIIGGREPHIDPRPYRLERFS